MLLGTARRERLTGAFGISLLLFTPLSHSACRDQDALVPAEPDPALEVLGVEPKESAVNVPWDAALTVRFSEPVELLEGASFRLNPDRPGTLQLTEAGRRVTWTPSEAMSPATLYRATLEAGAVRRASSRGEARPYDKDISWSFTTSANAPDEARGAYLAESGERAEVEIIKESGSRRTYRLETTASLRDNDPPEQSREIVEAPGRPIVRSGDVMFDALFALSLYEAEENSVSSIADGAFNNGQGVPCECFETGAKWNYVWTRDTAYAVDLGLALIDPERAKRSLLFKLSDRKGGDGSGAQIVQDTGSGGSWPVSTDRVVWALGAEALIDQLEGASLEDFIERAYPALVHTLEQDRLAVFDERDGLYRGEQSFLDWREQSYPSWTAQDTVHLAMGKSLSTNVGHLRLMRLTERLARRRDDSSAEARYRLWAEALAAAIDEELWLDASGMYSALKLGPLAPQALEKFELLGLSLAVLSDLGDEARRTSLVASYPHVAMGPPVLWPQQPLIPIYHNRGNWPFVTAYGLLAARRANNAEVFELDLESLIRGAALNLSNMENFEFTTQRPWYEDGAYSGPVVNSRRQLWSVAGYFGAIVKGLFGLEARDNALHLEPFVTSALHERWFGDSERLVLHDLPWRGALLSVEIVLPPEVATAPGAYLIERVTLNGEEVASSQRSWTREALPSQRARFVVELSSEVRASSGGATIVSGYEQDYTTIFAPREPSISEVRLVADRLEVSFEGAGEQGVVYDVWRDGERVAEGVEAGTFRDESSHAWRQRAHCYSVVARFVSSAHVSHPSRASCYWGDGTTSQARLERYGAEAFDHVGGGRWSIEHGRGHYGDWGDLSDELSLRGWQPRRSGEHLIQLTYGNGSGGFQTGITAAVKQVVLESEINNQEISRGYVVMPQLSEWTRWGESSFVSMNVKAGQAYRLRVIDGLNMSYFSHFIPYTGGQGGGPEAFNRANIAALTILAREGEPQGEVAVRFDGVEDLNKIPLAQRYEPAAAMHSWSRWGVEWDDHALYLVLVSESMSEPFKAAMVYLQDVSQGEASASRGIEYGDQRAALPFSPRWMVSWRSQGFGEDGQAPWSGVYERVDEEDTFASWRRVWGLSRGTSAWVSADGHTFAVRVPRSLLQGSRALRLVGHVSYGQPGQEWKETIPREHTPWIEGGGGYLELDLEAPEHDQSTWRTRP